MAAYSGKDFEYCEICRQSHRKGKKHLYSKAHRDKMKYVLRRFGQKVKLAKEDISAPCILDESDETEGNYWCYLCKSEVAKHVSDGHVTIRNAGFIEHLKSASHLVNTDKFWKDYRLERELKLQYVVTQDEFGAYKPALEKALDTYEEEQQRVLAHRAAVIRRMESERQKLLLPDWNIHVQQSSEFGGTAIVSSAVELHGNHGNGGTQEEPGCSHWNGEVNPDHKPKSTPAINQVSGVSSKHHGNHGNLNEVKFSRKTTTSVLDSGGLTSIGIQSLRPGEGNIHTGATPPWLVDDDDDESDGMLGPSLEDFNKHLERERKRKLNPNRVGANFDHVTPTRDEWLPSFGRVWNHGRRWQSRHQFKKESGQTAVKRKRPNNGTKPPATQSKPP